MRLVVGGDQIINQMNEEIFIGNILNMRVNLNLGNSRPN